MAKLRLTPTIKQDEAWKYMQDDITEVIGFGGGAGSGKSFWGVTQEIVMSYRYPGYKGFLARNELKRLMGSTFVTFKKACEYYGVPTEDWSLDGKYNVIKWANGSTIDLLDVAFKPTDEDYERFGSLEYTRGFGEELGEWHFNAFDILKSRVGRHNLFDTEKQQFVSLNMDEYEADPSKYPNIEFIHPKFFGGFNPSRNWVKRIFYTPWKNGELPEGYAFVPALYSDNPYTARSYKKQLDGIINTVNRARLRDGDWDYDDDVSALVSFEDLQDMFTNTIIKKPEKYLVVDVARKGADSTVFSFWEGMELYKVERYQKQTTDKTEQQAKDFAAKEQIPYSHILIDEDGIGGGVVDHLTGSKGFVANSSAIPTHNAVVTRKIKSFGATTTNFRNLKAQCAFKIAEIIRNHGISITAENIRDEMIEDLAALLKEKDADKETKLQIVSKDEIKQDIGRSPDLGDTVIMRAWFELMEDVTGTDPLRGGRLKNQMMHNRLRNRVNIVE